MADEFDLGADPFAAGAKGLRKIHIRVQMRNGRKCVTSIAGLDDDLDLQRIMKHMKNKFHTNGNISKDDEYGEVIQLQGDHRHNAKEWLLENEVLTANEADRIVIHGF